MSWTELLWIQESVTLLLQGDNRTEEWNSEQGSDQINLWALVIDYRQMPYFMRYCLRPHIPWLLNFYHTFSYVQCSTCKYSRDLTPLLLTILPFVCTYTRVYLNILPDVNMGAKDTVTQFKETMDILISKFATRLLKLNVDEVEVKVCTPATNDTITILPCYTVHGLEFKQQLYFVTCD